MLTNQLLGNMTIEDLTQRYRDSWVRYDGRIAYVSSFYNHTDDDPGDFVRGQRMVTLNYENSETVHLPFEWQKVDVSRPNPGWYLTSDYDRDTTPKKHFVYLQPNNARQWSRGLNRHTMSFFSLTCPHDYVNAYDLYHQAYTRSNNFKHRLSLNEVLAETQKSKGVILQPFLTVLPTNSKMGNWFDIYWRNITIGQIKDKTVTFNKPQFEDEVRESIFDLRANNRTPGALPYEDKERDKWFTIDMPRQTNVKASRPEDGLPRFFNADWAAGMARQGAARVQINPVPNEDLAVAVEQLAQMRTPPPVPPPPPANIPRLAPPTREDVYGLRRLTRAQLNDLARLPHIAIQPPIIREIGRYLQRINRIENVVRENEERF